VGEQFLLRLYSGSIQALFRLYQGSIQAADSSHFRGKKKSAGLPALFVLNIITRHKTKVLAVVV
jgi:hypothetical protein